MGHIVYGVYLGHLQKCYYPFSESPLQFPSNITNIHLGGCLNLLETTEYGHPTSEWLGCFKTFSQYLAVHGSQLRLCMSETTFWQDQRG